MKSPHGAVVALWWRCGGVVAAQWLRCGGAVVCVIAPRLRGDCAMIASWWRRSFAAVGALSGSCVSRSCDRVVVALRLRCDCAAVALRLHRDCAAVGALSGSCARRPRSRPTWTACAATPRQSSMTSSGRASRVRLRLELEAVWESLLGGAAETSNSRLRHRTAALRPRTAALRPRTAALRPPLCSTSHHCLLISRHCLLILGPSLTPLSSDPGPEPHTTVS